MGIFVYFLLSIVPCSVKAFCKISTLRFLGEIEFLMDKAAAVPAACPVAKQHGMLLIEASVS
jgi:spore maturation protein SpmB